MPFTPLDHTADLGYDLEAASREELYAEAARAFTDTITELERVAARQELAVEVEAGDAELLLVEWLNELLYRFETTSFLPTSAAVAVEERPGGLRLRGRLRGEPFDPARHPFKVQIKAVTYHGLEVRHDADRWRGRVIFDI